MHRKYLKDITNDNGYFRGSGLLVLKNFYFFSQNTHRALAVALSEKKQVPFSMVIENVELMHEFSQTLTHGNSKNEIRQRNKRT